MRLLLLVGSVLILACGLESASNGSPFVVLTQAGHLQLLDQTARPSKLIRLDSKVEEYDLHTDGSIAWRNRACVQGGGSLFIAPNRAKTFELRWSGSVFGNPPGYSSPAWSPNGQHLAFVVRQCVSAYKDTALMVGHLGIWHRESGVVDVWGAETEGDFLKPLWSADGRLILVNFTEGGFKVFETAARRLQFETTRLAGAYAGSKAGGFIGNKCVVLQGSKDGYEFKRESEILYLPDASIRPSASIVGERVALKGPVTEVEFPYFLSTGENRRVLLGSFLTGRITEAPSGSIQLVSRGTEEAPRFCE